MHDESSLQVGGHYELVRSCRQNRSTGILMRRGRVSWGNAQNAPNTSTMGHIRMTSPLGVTSFSVWAIVAHTKCDCNH